MERKFSVTLTIDQYNTIKTALNFELMQNKNSETSSKLLQSALDAVNAAQVIN